METDKPRTRPKTPPTKKKTRASKLSKEQILLALQKKKECNARAQKIVEEFLDPVPDDKIEYFLSCLVHINQAHYDDIVEERSIAKLCGYPICEAMLSNIPKQQFVIASSQNKVYDITERKKFCSNKCFKASLYLKEQILSTPLWVRKEDDILPEFKLLSFDNKDDDQGKNTDRQVDESTEKCTTNDKKEQNHNDESTEKDNSQATQIAIRLN